MNNKETEENLWGRKREKISNLKEQEKRKRTREREGGGNGINR